MDDIEIIYISNLCSQRVLNNLFVTSKIKPSQEVQKFHRLLTEGIANANILVNCISVIPMSTKDNNKIFFYEKNENLGNIIFKYLFIVNIPILKTALIALNYFTKIALLKIRSKKKKIKIICDSLYLTGTYSALIAAKLFQIEIIAIVTDIPELMKPAANNKFNLKSYLFEKGSNFIFHRFSKYVLFTEQMNSIVNPNRRPYVIIEGLVDIEMKSIRNLYENKPTTKIIMYAGGLFEKYGIKKLMNAFSKLQNSDIQLLLFGMGDMIPDILSYSQKDRRIIYGGILLNAEIVEMELKATILVNPRSSKEEFSKFSFPSKNMEYMVSGTPLLTTKLPGMPNEYYPYVYFFDDESEFGIYSKLKEILNIPQFDLHAFGFRAKDFVLTEKNNLVQAKKLISLLRLENYN
jgi:glycosyltransferase involved in cell wall biosynthesis